MRDQRRMGSCTRLPAASAGKRQRAKVLRHEMTEAERALWRYLRSNVLDGLHFRRQQPIAGFLVDFYCHAAHVVFEVDGGIHDEQGATDAERDAILTGLGFHVLRFRNEQVMGDLDAVLAHISATCHSSR